MEAQLKDLLIYCNMGLGDALIVNGLVRYLAAGDRNVIFLCKPHNYVSIEWMFRDRANILVKSVRDDAAAEEFINLHLYRMPDDDYELMRLGCTGPGWKGSADFDRQFYSQAGVPFEQRWEGFHVERCPEQHRTPPYQFYFIHDDSPRGFIIADPKFCAPIVRAAYDPMKPNIFAWQNVLERATEVHCIPSAFSVLIDSLPAIKQKLYLHGSARPGWDKHTYRKDWTIL